VSIIKFPDRTYTAKLFEVEDFKVAGTLDGYLDLALPGGTYQISPTKALALAAALRAAVEDVRANCLYDNDVLLEQL
jgi:hypothetical protein